MEVLEPKSWMASIWHSLHRMQQTQVQLRNSILWRGGRRKEIHVKIRMDPISIGIVKVYEVMKADASTRRTRSGSKSTHFWAPGSGQKRPKFTYTQVSHPILILRIITWSTNMNEWPDLVSTSYLVSKANNAQTELILLWSQDTSLDSLAFLRTKRQTSDPAIY